ncbi:MAG: hypothetical protein JNN11_03190 [Candidatus Doudnabacteria bacterium]|nr:hypothetical protein [Candidatus Doudnabacteria bacterium]
MTTFRLIFEQNELEITNMTTLPLSQLGRGFGARALEKVAGLARGCNFKAIKAVQISDEESENFWKKNGFIKDLAPNRSNNYILQF